ncbi:KH domain-containing, RNA-binding, signal transduction-associated protein 2 isoform X2 [Nematostella vectensis]|uniref:KH domain-containing, RNA-binding, signal transduction-associated protein 2 isoform X2 n=1 Tax=Nematostella vectensis TaxID=45351 RepID=UPI0013901ECB|nr:KH domain-containing, RNA-binding, signal transduction-associated protein 2 isoform X2 [Nematostella vectensis]
MESEPNYLQDLLAEKESLDPSFIHCMRLLTSEINRVQSGGTLVMSPMSEDEKAKNGEKGEGSEEDPLVEGGQRPPRERREPRQWRRPFPTEEGKLYKPVKLSEKVFIPVKDHPKFNFVGKLLGPRGNTFKRLQNSTGTKMSILGKGSMRDKEKEEELRATEDPKYAHLGEELHVLIEVEAPPGQAHARLGIAIEEIKKYLIPEMNDEIHQEQMREMAILNSIEDTNNNPAPPQAAQPLPTPTARGRPRPRPIAATPGHPLGIPVSRTGPPIGMRPRISHHHQTLTAAARSAAGLPSSPTLAQPAPRAQAPHAGDPYLIIPDQTHHLERLPIHETYDPTYAAYEAAYAEADDVQYYDYGRGPAEIYETAYPTAVRLQPTGYKTPQLRPAKKVAREATLPY